MTAGAQRSVLTQGLKVRVRRAFPSDCAAVRPTDPSRVLRWQRRREWCRADWVRIRTCDMFTLMCLSVSYEYSLCVCAALASAPRKRLHRGPSAKRPCGCFACPRVCARACRCLFVCARACHAQRRTSHIASASSSICAVTRLVPADGTGRDDRLSRASCSPRGKCLRWPPVRGCRRFAAACATLMHRLGCGRGGAAGVASVARGGSTANPTLAAACFGRGGVRGAMSTELRLRLLVLRAALGVAAGARVDA